MKLCIWLLVLGVFGGTIAKPGHLKEEKHEFQFSQTSQHPEPRAYDYDHDSELTPWAKHHKIQVQQLADKMQAEYNTAQRTNFAAFSSGTTLPQAYSWSFQGKTQEDVDNAAKLMTSQVIQELNTGRLLQSEMSSPHFFVHRAAAELERNNGQSRQYYNAHSYGRNIPDDAENLQQVQQNVFTMDQFLSADKLAAANHKTYEEGDKVLIFNEQTGRYEYAYVTSETSQHVPVHDSSYFDSQRTYQGPTFMQSGARRDDEDYYDNQQKYKSIEFIDAPTPTPVDIPTRTPPRSYNLERGQDGYYGNQHNVGYQPVDIQTPKPEPLPTRTYSVDREQQNYYGSQHKVEYQGHEEKPIDIPTPKPATVPSRSYHAERVQGNYYGSQHNVDYQGREEKRVEIVTPDPEKLPTRNYNEERRTDTYYYNQNRNGYQGYANKPVINTTPKPVAIPTTQPTTNFNVNQENEDDYDDQQKYESFYENREVPNPPKSYNLEGRDHQIRTPLATVSTTINVERKEENYDYEQQYQGHVNLPAPTRQTLTSYNLEKEKTLEIQTSKPVVAPTRHGIYNNLGESNLLVSPLFKPKTEQNKETYEDYIRRLQVEQKSKTSEMYEDDDDEQETQKLETYDFQTNEDIQTRQQAPQNPESNIMSLAPKKNKVVQYNRESEVTLPTTSTTPKPDSNVMSMLAHKKQNIDMSETYTQIRNQISSVMQQHAENNSETHFMGMSSNRDNTAYTVIEPKTNDKNKNRGDRTQNNLGEDYESEENLEQEPGIGFYPTDRRSSTTRRPSPIYFYNAPLAPIPTTIPITPRTIPQNSYYGAPLATYPSGLTRSQYEERQLLQSENRAQGNLPLNYAEQLEVEGDLNQKTTDLNEEHRRFTAGSLVIDRNDNVYSRTDEQSHHTQQHEFEVQHSIDYDDQQVSQSVVDFGQELVDQRHQNEDILLSYTSSDNQRRDQPPEQLFSSRLRGSDSLAPIPTTTEEVAHVAEVTTPVIIAETTPPGVWRRFKTKAKDIFG